MANKFIPRLFVDKEELDIGTTISMDKNTSHYLRTVMRLDLHKMIYLFNNISGEFEATIIELGKNGVKFTVGDRIRYPKDSLPLRLLCAPISKDRFRFMLEKATELGVNRFSPVLTDHTNAPKVHVPKSLMHIKEAVQQSERLDIPEMDQPEKLGKVLKHWDKNVPLLYCTESGEGDNITDVLEDLEGKEIAVLVGPEGGFSLDEHEFLQTKSYVKPVTVGPRIMRAETATIAVLSVVQALIGDWNERLNDEIVEEEV